MVDFDGLMGPERNRVNILEVLKDGRRMTVTEIAAEMPNGAEPLVVSYHASVLHRQGQLERDSERRFWIV